MASGEDPSNGWEAVAAHLIASRGRSRIGISNIDEGENYYYARPGCDMARSTNAPPREHGNDGESC
jgi:hypothetical protein